MKSRVKKVNLNK